MTQATELLSKAGATGEKKNNRFLSNFELVPLSYS